MGYTTDFDGCFNLDLPLADEHAAYLRAFSRTRRMKRDPQAAEGVNDDVRTLAGLPIGEDAGYFVGGSGLDGQSNGESVVNYNQPPEGQPGLWCQWVPTLNSNGIEWDGGEKFYHYTEWLNYLLTHFLKPWGYVLTGEVKWQGKDPDDFGKIVIADGVAKEIAGRKVYGDEV